MKWLATDYKNFDYVHDCLLITILYDTPFF